MAAIDFSNDPAAYFDWIQTNTEGYVLNARTPALPSRLMLHKSSCGTIRPNSQDDDGFNGVQYFKVCASHAADLAEWARDHVKGARGYTHLCKTCKPEAPIELLPSPQFTKGRIYDRWSEINDPFGGSRQSGISTSSLYPAIFLFSGDSGEKFGYIDGDGEKDEVYYYTGEGQSGDMQFTKGNLAIRDHAQKGRSLHLFKSKGRSKGQKYIGEFSSAGYFYKDRLDKNNILRRTIVFELVPDQVDIETLFEAREEEEEPSLPSTLEQARKKALEALVFDGTSSVSEAPRKLYKRSKAVKDYVLLRAGGICESCDDPAPFKKKDGTDYLEPHHTTRLSDGGLDHFKFVAAVCPSCHRQIHHGIGGDEKNSALMKLIRMKEGE